MSDQDTTPSEKRLRQLEEELYLLRHRDVEGESELSRILRGGPMHCADLEKDYFMSEMATDLHLASPDIALPDYPSPWVVMRPGQLDGIEAPGGWGFDYGSGPAKDTFLRVFGPEVPGETDDSDWSKRDPIPVEGQREGELTTYVSGSLLRPSEQYSSYARIVSEKYASPTPGIVAGGGVRLTTDPEAQNSDVYFSLPWGTSEGLLVPSDSGPWVARLQMNLSQSPVYPDMSGWRFDLGAIGFFSPGGFFNFIPYRPSEEANPYLRVEGLWDVTGGGGDVEILSDEVVMVINNYAGDAEVTNAITVDFWGVDEQGEATEKFASREFAPTPTDLATGLDHIQVRPSNTADPMEIIIRSFHIWREHPEGFDFAKASPGKSYL